MTTSAYPEQWHPFFTLSQDGTVVHRTRCPLGYDGKSWMWSDFQPLVACMAIAAAAGWTACEYCEPFR